MEKAVGVLSVDMAAKLLEIFPTIASDDIFVSSAFHPSAYGGLCTHLGPRPPVRNLEDVSCRAPPLGLVVIV